MYGLVPEPRGSFGNLVPAPVDTTALAPGQVALRVAAVGVNFRDVLNVLGMYPGDPGAPGGDCAGVVLAAGPGVSLQPGAAVFGLAVGSLGTAVVCNAGTLVAQPPNLSAEQAATMPTVFITAHMTLHAAAGVGAGDTVLLTAGAGGVGLAAGQVLSGVGARVVATAGSPSKRALLRGAGVEVVVGSRDSGFTGPLVLLGGCDVVLNSLTSPGMVGGGLAVLKRGGRWVEIGKRDIWSAAAVGVERPDVGYSLVAVDFMTPGGIHAAMTAVSAGVASGRLSPLPAVVHPLSSVAAALRQMSQARHVGKVVVRVPPMHQPTTFPVTMAEPGAVLVIGGTGVLGTQVVQWLAEQGIQHIPVVSRSGQASQDLQQLLSSSTHLTAVQQCQVTVLAADASSSSDASGILAAVQELPVPLIGVMHAGGVLADALLEQQQLSGLRKVAAAKPAVLPLIQHLSMLAPVSSTVLFSSVAALLGSPGQSNYAAANAALDAAAGALQGAGLGVVSVQWGAWAGAGMAAADASTSARVARSGMALLQPAQGLAALEGVLHSVSGGTPSSHPAAALAAVPFSWDAFLQRFPAGSVPPLLKHFEQEVAAARGDAAAGAAAATGRAASSLTPERVRSIVESTVSNVLGSTVPASEPLMAAGLDSLGAVELRNALETATGLQLPATLLFDFPSVFAVSQYITSQVPAAAAAAGSAEQQAMALAQPAPLPSMAAGHLADGLVIGVTGTASMSPGSVIRSTSGADAIQAVPLERWDWQGLASSAGSAAAGVVPARFGGWLESIEMFDAAAFGISTAEAELMDVQQRLLLHLTHQALTAAAASTAAASILDVTAGAGAAGCVAVGIASAEYNNWVLRRQQVASSAYSATGGALSVASGRLAFLYGMRGAALSVDTACSSSLVAAHFAGGQLRSSTSRVGLVAGVGLLLSPEPSSMFQKAGMLAPDGRCKTLDAAADGYVRAEAAGVLVLQILAADALPADCTAVLLGSAVNQDGRSSSLTAPNGPAQQEVVRAALASAGLAADNVTSLQLHGTGTALGDPIELGAAAAVFMGQQQVARQQPLVTTASKSWMGHSEAAAGSMGLIHSHVGLTQLLGQPLMHLSAVNPYLVPTLGEPGSSSNSWVLPRQPGGLAVLGQEAAAVTGVSSFAFQGTNAHALLARSPTHPWRQQQQQLVGHAAAAALVWEAARTYVAPPVSLLLCGCQSAAGGQLVLSCHLQHPELQFLWQHQVQQQAVMPTAGLLEMAAAAMHIMAPNSSGSSLTQVVLPGALLLPPVGAAASDVCVVVDVRGGRMQVVSGAAPGSQRPHLLAVASSVGPAATAAAYTAATPAPPAAAAVQEDGPEAHALKQLMDVVDVLGLVPEHLSEAMLLAAADSSGLEGGAGGLLLHPGLVEGALTMAALAAGGTTTDAAAGGPLHVPASMAAVQLQSTAGAAASERRQLLVAAVGQPAAAQQHQACLTATGAGGRVVVSIAGADFRQLHLLGTSAATQQLLLSPAAVAGAVAGADVGAAAPAFTPDRLAALVRDTVEGILGNPVGEQEPLMAAGLDSLAATEVRANLQQAVGMELPATLVYDHPTMSSISSYLQQRMAPASQLVAAAGLTGAAGLVRLRRQQGTAVVVGVAGCSAPAHTLQQYAAGGDGITLVPFWRWDAVTSSAAAAAASGAGAAADELLPRFGGFLPGVDLFDCQLFGITPREAAGMDPQQRLLLKAAAEAMPSLGGAAAEVVAAYVGIGSSDYELLGHHTGQPVGAFSFTSASASVASGRLSYVMGLKGPSASIDTACSASLVALHMGAVALQDGSATGAVVGGVLLSLVPQSTLMVQRAGMAAPDGRCKVFDAEADGYVRGEACRALYLTTKTTASSSSASATEQQQEQLLAVLQGTAVNSNGRASSLTAPHGPTQQELIATALAAAQLQPAQVSALQLHANGTALGDPIEVGAVAAAYQLQQGNLADPDRVFAFHSVKGFTGHQEAAAGVSALLEGVSVLTERCLAPMLHLRTLNPYVAQPLQGASVRINSSAATAPLAWWQAEAAVNMGVSSFGAQGTNAHAIVSVGTTTSARAAAADAAGAALGLHLEQQRCWVQPLVQQLLTRCLVSRFSRASAPRMVFEVVLGVPGLAWLRDYSSPAAGGQPAQPFLSNAALVSMAASAAHLLTRRAEVSTGAAEGSQQGVVLQHLVAAAPQVLPIQPGAQPGDLHSLLVVAASSMGSIHIEAAGQRQLQCSVGASPPARADEVTQTTTTTSSSSSPAGQAQQAALTAQLLVLLGEVLYAAAARHMPLQQQQQRQLMHVSGQVQCDDLDTSGYVVHPAVLESSLQVAMVSPVASSSSAEALWLSAVQCLQLPAPSTLASVQGAATAVAADFSQGSDGNSTLIERLLMAGPGATPGMSLIGGVLVADAMAAAEAAAALEVGDVVSAGTALGASPGTPTAAGLGAAAAAAAANPLAVMPEEERALYLQAQILSEVRQMVGHTVHPDEPLITAGVDSRAGMELRQTLTESLGITLPVTVLYDYQTVNALVDFISGEISSRAAPAAGAAAPAGEAEGEADAPAARSRAAAAGGGGGEQPSELLKVLRPAPAPRPLFLAAPGVANAQSAYFAFAQFLQWSDQPIYVLEKDNDLDIAALARQNAADILKVQPEGPYLLGGHSYGGVVAMEIALVLEEAGHDVGLLVVSMGWRAWQ
jgi:acyl transferase domain-containing protein/NADPH:quinone reductase-like Zn-dependent oxidoreductase/acyl carrier protein